MIKTPWKHICCVLGFIALAVPFVPQLLMAGVVTNYPGDGWFQSYSTATGTAKALQKNQRMLLTYSGGTRVTASGRTVRITTDLSSLATKTMLTNESTARQQFDASHAAKTYPHIGGKDKSGFTSRTDAYLSFSSSSRAFRVHPTASTFSTWNNGQNYLSPLQRVVLTNSIGMHYVYMLEGIIYVSTSPWDITGTSAPLATVYWTGSAGSVGDERHSADRDRMLHKMLHNTVGARYADGLTCTFATGSLSCTSGSIYDEDILHSISALASVRVWYKNHASSSTFVDGVSTPYYTVAGSLKFNNNTTLSSVSSGYHVNNYLYATNDIDYPLAMVIGQAQYNLIADARSEAQPTLAGLTTQEWKLIYRMTAKTTGNNVSYVESTDYRTSSSLPGGVVSSLPATNVTYSPYTTTRTWTNVQQAITETNRIIPVTCGTDPSTAIFDGAPGAPALFCNISGGIRSVTYDKDGLNPLPALTAFILKVYEGATEVIAQTISWWTGGSSNRIYGTGTGRTFTPSVKPTYSHISSANYVIAQAQYSSIYGKRYCKAGTPVAVTMTGSTGATGATGITPSMTVGTVTKIAAGGTPYVTFTGTTTARIVNFGLVTGDTGPAASVTRAAVLSSFASDAGVDQALLLKPSSSGSVNMLEAWDSTGMTRIRVTSTGLIYAFDSAGKLVWGFDSSAQRFVMSRYSTASSRLNFSVDRYGQEIRYAPNGTTVLYRSYTTGRAIWYNKVGRQTMKLYSSGRLEL